MQRDACGVQEGGQGLCEGGDPVVFYEGDAFFGQAGGDLFGDDGHGVGAGHDHSPGRGLVQAMKRAKTPVVTWSAMRSLMNSSR